MPAVPTTSPATGRPTGPAFIHTTQFNFVDNAGRTLLLRGVNLSGSSKAPVGCPSQLRDNFWEDAEAGGRSFHGRPLNLDDGTADIHLARLRGWGFNMLRYPVTWEAIEHQGPGIYDEEFMDYTIRVLQKCKEYGFRVYMDPHQDTWSRFSGGSGAPYWTLAACGIEPSNITATQSAIIHCEYPLPHDPDPSTLPAMIWSTNYGRLLSQTLFTLFFSGSVFAPKCIIDGVNIQEYLQSHYIEAMGRLADRIAAYDAGSLLEECVIGWDSLNEPFEGLCGWADLNVIPAKQGSTLKKGPTPTPAEGLRLGMGQAQTVDNWTFGMFGPSKVGSVTVDPKGRKLWAEPEEGGELPSGHHPRWNFQRDVSHWPLGTCIWALHGVWDIETGYMMRPDYFKFNPQTGEEVEFITDYWKPHWCRFARRIRKAHPEAIIFVQPPVFARPPSFDAEDDDENASTAEEELKGRCAYSGHYYDGLTLVTRHWNWFNADALGLLRGKYKSQMAAVKIGSGAIRKSLQEQLGMLKSDTHILGGAGYPTVIGEIGTPFDMDNKRSYGYTDGGRWRGDYSNQEKALDASLNGADGPNALSYTIWTFCPDEHSHEWSDGWNMEDLSLWSPDDVGLRRRKVRDGEKKKRKDKPVNVNASRETVGTLGTVDMMYSLGSESQAVLLRKKHLRTVAAAAASSLSLATLGSPSTFGVKPIGVSTATNTTATNTPDPNASPALDDTYARYGYHANPYDFLTDGARAVKAFARPYPVKTVGLPSNIRFDIGKAYFKLVVSVRAEDRMKEGGLAAVPLGAKDGTGVHVQSVVEDDDEEEEGEQLATEIFVPLVHYAHQRLLDDHSPFASSSSSSSPISPSKAPHRGRSPYPDGRSISSRSELHYEGGMRSVLELVEHSDSSAESQATAINKAAPIHASYPPKSSCHTQTHQMHEADLVDVDVKVSSGKWSVEGQTLKWWYEVPKDGEPPREYTIEVRRRGGPIVVNDYFEPAERLESEDDEHVHKGGCCSSDSGCTVM